ncbi:hypothetical protein KP509_24G016200 [Ceratopteris richardii]|nr:hypothetical protein KP509_24G016200 [Ceratopteris richardii]
MNFTSLKSGKGFDERTGGTAMRLEEEILKRMKAEANVLLWEKRWNEMVKRCASLGISIGSEADNVLKGESEALEMLNQELVVARLVAGAIARAVVRVEKDEEFESMLGLKNREISRLWDKLQYLELVNREMSQRNLEVTESNQRRKKRRQRRQKLAINTFCAALLIGTAGLACYTYVPWDKFKIWDTTLQQSTDI